MRKYLTRALDDTWTDNVRDFDRLPRIDAKSVHLRHRANMGPHTSDFREANVKM
jgi:hypothetical protein